MHSKEEIIDFLTANKDNFNEWNKTAFANLNALVKTLIVSDAVKKEIHNLKRLLTRRINSNNIDNSEHIRINHYDKCGLIMKEILYDAKKVLIMINIFTKLSMVRMYAQTHLF